MVSAAQEVIPQLVQAQEAQLVSTSTHVSTADDADTQEKSADAVAKKQDNVTELISSTLPMAIGAVNETRKEAAEVIRGARSKATEVLTGVSSRGGSVLCSAQVRIGKVFMQAKEQAANVQTRLNGVAVTWKSQVSRAVDNIQGRISTAVLEPITAYGAKMSKAAKTAKQASLETTYAVRAAITSSHQRFLEHTTEIVENARAQALGTFQNTTSRAQAAALKTKAKALELRKSAREVASDGKYQAVAAGAVGGAVTMGATGGATGLATGGAVGAAVGLIPALFTFGLSIPIGAAVGGGVGLFVGTAFGGSAGALGGGAASYGVYSKRAEIRNGACHTLVKVGHAAGTVRAKAAASVDFVKEQASAVRTRIVNRTPSLD